MPSRKRNIRLAKSPTDTTTTEPVATEPVATEPVATEPVAEPVAPTTEPVAPTTEPELPADIDPAIANDSDLTTAEKLFLHSLPDTTEPVATVAPTTEPVAEPSNRSKLQAEFDEKRCAAITSSLGLYDGPSLAVHRSDKQPADAPYLSRVAKPVQIAKNIKPRDDANLLACYDHLTTYYGGDYTAGFNPARFGADLGAISRNASLNRLGLTPDGQHVVLTPLGLANARNLAASRAKLAAKAKSGE